MAPPGVRIVCHDDTYLVVPHAARLAGLTQSLLITQPVGMKTFVLTIQQVGQHLSIQPTVQDGTLITEHPKVQVKQLLSQHPKVQVERQGGGQVVNNIKRHFFNEAKRLSISVSVNKNANGNHAELTGSEILEGRGIYIAPLCSLFRYKLFAHAAISNTKTLDIVSDYTRYYSVKGDTFDGIHTLILLPSSEVYLSVVDQNAIHSIKEQCVSAGVFHKSSSDAFKRFMSDMLPILPDSLNKRRQMAYVERIAVSGANADCIDAILSGKPVIDISFGNFGHAGTLTECFKYVMYEEDPRATLLKLLSNPLTGFCFTEDDVTKFMEHYKEHYL